MQIQNREIEIYMSKFLIVKEKPYLGNLTSS